MPLEDSEAEAHDHGDANGIGDLSLLGQYRDKNDVDGEKDGNTGGDVHVLSPGVRISSSDSWSPC